MSKRKREKDNGTKQRKKKKLKVSVEEWLPFPEEERDSYSDVEWITSHLIPNKILWSSDPTKIKPNIDVTTLPTHENNVVNTWFVESPHVSSNDSSDKWKVEIDAAAELLRNADAILIVAGAGMGVDSGLPDYRGPQGFWNAYPLLKEKGLSLESMSHPDWFESDPRAAWGFYAHRAGLYHSAKPHQGFTILRKLTITKKDYFVFTSNIDSQFQAAGFNSSKIFEAHGSLGVLQCVNDDCDEVWPARAHEIPAVDENLRAVGELPICPECGSLARPNVSMFGDTTVSWKDSRSLRQKQTFLKWMKNICGISMNENTTTKIEKKKNPSHPRNRLWHFTTFSQA